MFQSEKFHERNSFSPNAGANEFVPHPADDGIGESGVRSEHNADSWLEPGSESVDCKIKIYYQQMWISKTEDELCLKTLKHCLARTLRRQGRQRVSLSSGGVFDSYTHPLVSALAHNPPSLPLHQAPSPPPPSANLPHQALLNKPPSPSSSSTSHPHPPPPQQATLSPLLNEPPSSTSHPLPPSSTSHSSFSKSHLLPPQRATTTLNKNTTHSQALGPSGPGVGLRARSSSASKKFRRCSLPTWLRGAGLPRTSSRPWSKSVPFTRSSRPIWCLLRISSCSVRMVRDSCERSLTSTRPSFPTAPGNGRNCLSHLLRVLMSLIQGLLWYALPVGRGASWDPGQQRVVLGRRRVVCRFHIIHPGEVTN